MERFTREFWVIKYMEWSVGHDDVTKWKHCPRYWPFVRGIHRSPVNSPLIVQWRGALMFSLICTRINGWVNNRGAGDLRRHCTHYDVTVMISSNPVQSLDFIHADPSHTGCPSVNWGAMDLTNSSAVNRSISFRVLWLSRYMRIFMMTFRWYVCKYVYIIILFHGLWLENHVV